MLFCLSDIPKQKRTGRIAFITLTLLLFVDIIRGGQNSTSDMLFIRGVILCILFYGVSNIGLFFHVCLLIIGTIFFDSLVLGTVFSWLSLQMHALENPFYREGLLEVTLFFVSIIAYLMKRTNKKMYVTMLEKKEVGSVLLVFLFVGIYKHSFQYLIIYNEIRHDTLTHLFIGIGGLSMIGFLIRFMTIRKNVMLAERTQVLQETIISQQHTYYEKLQKQNEETKKFRHDILEHLYVLQILMKQKQYIALDDYLGELVGASNILKSTNQIETGSTLVNFLLMDIMIQYEHESIAVNWKGGIPENLGVSKKQQISLLANLLKNAFQATAKCRENKVIEVHSKAIKSHYYLMIKNPYVKEKKRTKTTRGYGLKIVGEIVESYNGHLSIVSDDCQFIIEITLPNVVKKR